MGCVSCAQKYAALKNRRQAENALVDSQGPRKVKVNHHGIIRKSEKPVEVPVVEKPLEEKPNENVDATGSSEANTDSPN